MYYIRDCRHRDSIPRFRDFLRLMGFFRGGKLLAKISEKNYREFSRKETYANSKKRFDSNFANNLLLGNSCRQAEIHCFQRLKLA